MPSPLSFSPLNKLKRFKSLKLCISKSLLNAPSLYEAILSLDHFHPKGIRLPSRVLAILLHHCSASKSYREGKLVHLHLKLTGFKHPTTYLANHLICMYFSCDDFVSARKARGVFDRMPERDFVSWNTMIVGYACNGVFGEALRFYGELKRLCIGYNGFSFASVLIVCVKMKDFELSRQILRKWSQHIITFSFFGFGIRSLKDAIFGYG
ncbi:hypothetical protein Ahy_A04g020708 [Arachis hypogaea]|uniref:Pentatricopeptide repeat-containing protein n=1 Tax=Arachis hypogaea TaxID=3818 RepID=A0A445DIE1_ARAHY|nr:hypothetical protein Ahy_A04g020708 [Arachis hypogaea]